MLILMDLEKTLEDNWIGMLGFFVIYAFLFSFFNPSLILSDTTAAGGDTATHNYAAYYMDYYLLKEMKLTGWSPGWYAGFPMFQFYFPILFFFISVMSNIIPLNVSFKVMTVLGTFLLPLMTYFSMRTMKFKKPAPLIAAALSLTFLFMEANSMWGGNIPSTLAGEFTFSFSFSLTVFFMGILYRRIELENSKFHLSDPGILSMITLSHVYTLLFSITSSGFFMFTKNKGEFYKRTLFFVKTYGLAFLLTAFWTIPLIAEIGYTTPYNHVWKIKNWSEVFPPILLPVYLISVLSAIHGIRKKDRRIMFIIFSVVVSVTLYKLAPLIGIVDIRFIPFLQFYPILIASYGVSEMFKSTKFDSMKLSLAFIILTIFWVNANVGFIDDWIIWNYEGFENKSLWDSYIAVNEFLEGDQNDPRVVYEHSTLHDAAGSTRAFENLPLFSGRSTLEGLYMQSSISAPFVFYIQSQISEQRSCPFPDYSCDSMTAALPRLKMFNVGNVIARSDEAIEDYMNDDNYIHLANIGPFEIFKINYDTGYVEVPKYEPVYFETEDWKSASYEWFKKDENLGVPLVFDNGLKEKLEQSNELEFIPKDMIRKECIIEEKIYNERIEFNTTCLGEPHIIKVSYFPNWKVEGAEKVYLVSPSFMMVYPENETVVLNYTYNPIDRISQLLTLSGVFMVAYSIKVGYTKKR